MDTIYTTELVALGASLAELAVKGTATAVSTKIKAIRDEKNQCHSVKHHFSGFLS